MKTAVPMLSPLAAELTVSSCRMYCRWTLSAALGIGAERGNGCVWTTEKAACAGEGMVRGTIAGTCERMCPEGEVERRTRIEDIALFERPDPRVAATTPALAVKKFARNVCGHSPLLLVPGLNK